MRKPDKEFFINKYNKNKFLIYGVIGTGKTEFLERLIGFNRSYDNSLIIHCKDFSESFNFYSKIAKAKFDIGSPFVKDLIENNRTLGLLVVDDVDAFIFGQKLKVDIGSENPLLLLANDKSNILSDWENLSEKEFTDAFEESIKFIDETEMKFWKHKEKTHIIVSGHKMLNKLRFVENCLLNKFKQYSLKEDLDDFGIKSNHKPTIVIVKNDYNFDSDNGERIRIFVVDTNNLNLSDNWESIKHPGGAMLEMRSLI